MTAQKPLSLDHNGRDSNPKHEDTLAAMTALLGECFEMRSDTANRHMKCQLAKWMIKLRPFLYVPRPTLSQWMSMQAIFL